MEVPADVTVGMCWARFTAALIANHAGIMGGHVEGVGSVVAEVSTGVGGGADGGAECGGGEVRVLEEVGVGGGGGSGREGRVKGTWDGTAECELHVVEEKDVKSGYVSGGGHLSVC